MFRRTTQTLFLFLGILFLLVGVVGIVVPLLPTTPFLLLAAFCFDRGSPYFHSWLLNHPLFGPPILDWKKHRAIRTEYKIIASSMMAVSVYFIGVNERIPVVGKLSFAVFIIAMNVYIWTRNRAP